MELSTFRIAEENRNATEDLKKQLENINNGAWHLGCEIILKTGYSDMGHDYTTKANFKGDIGTKVVQAIRDIVSSHIEILDKEFEEL